MTTVRERIEQFCTAYYLGDAHTFCDPDTGEMVSATYEVQAFANALINGPLMDDADEVDPRIAEAVAVAERNPFLVFALDRVIAEVEAMDDAELAAVSKAYRQSGVAMDMPVGRLQTQILAMLRALRAEQSADAGGERGGGSP